MLRALRSASMSALRRLRTAMGGSAVVLSYHRFGFEPLDPQGLALRPEVFEPHVRALAQGGYNAITAAELFACLEERRRIPDRTIVVTIDDGYADALEVAQPILEEHGVPATVFVSSGALGNPNGFWWDEVEYLLLHPGVLQERLELPGGDGFARDIAPEASELDEATAASFHGWTVTQAPVHPRQQLYLDVFAHVTALDAASRNAAMAALREHAEPAGQPPARRPLMRREVVRLESGGLVEIGGHTSNHLVLAGRTPSEQRLEIAGDKLALEFLCGHPLVSFAYPYGGAGDYDATSVAVVASSGYLGAFTTRLGMKLPWGSVGAGTNRFEAPRTHASRLTAHELIALVEKRLAS